MLDTGVAAVEGAGGTDRGDWAIVLSRRLSRCFMRLPKDSISDVGVVAAFVVLDVSSCSLPRGR